MRESKGDDGWEELDEDDRGNGNEMMIPEGREMNVEEERQFLAVILSELINANVARIGESKMG
jgi:hypothetical protein